MQGRLENKIKNENNINEILKTLPNCVSNYYNSRPNKESKGSLEYIRKIRHFLRFIDENTLNINIEKITESDVAKYLKSIERTIDNNGNERETSFAYRKQVFTVLNSFFEYLRKRKIIQENPMDCIDRPDSSDKVEKVLLYEDDLKNILQSIDCGAGTDEQKARQENWKERDRAILLTFIMTGMRETALTEINLNDVDLDNNKIVIVDKRHTTHEYIINDILKESLINWINKRKQIDAESNCEALFLSNRRTRITPGAVSLIVKKFSKEGIDKEISPHKLRAAFCTIMYNKTGDIEKVRDSVGHSNIMTTQRYVVKDNSAKIEAAKIMDDIFG